MTLLHIVGNPTCGIGTETNLELGVVGINGTYQSHDPLLNGFIHGRSGRCNPISTVVLARHCGPTSPLGSNIGNQTNVAFDQGCSCFDSFIHRRLHLGATSLDANTLHNVHIGEIFIQSLQHIVPIEKLLGPTRRRRSVVQFFVIRGSSSSTRFLAPFVLAGSKSIHGHVFFKCSVGCLQVSRRFDFRMGGALLCRSVISLLLDEFQNRFAHPYGGLDLFSKCPLFLPGQEPVIEHRFVSIP
mmetsp:Transcript_33584/g.77460  ORF Transcript_33584/g.77460 Transcript_33584/m.77460 type:complete len:242 (+) Transcript_33584:1099-1824(+)